MEENVAKKNNKPLLIIGVAVLLILAGAALILTGNNKSFLGGDNGPEEPKTEDPTPIEDDDPQRGLVPNQITPEEVLQALINKKEAEFSDQLWNIGEVRILAHDENYEKYLVEYDEISETGEIVVKQTIVSYLNGEIIVELPGWIDGERDLLVYNFIYDDGTEEPIEEPTEDEPIEEPIVDEPVVDEPTVDEPVTIDEQNVVE